MRVAIYARVSSKSRQRPGTVASQVAALRTHAREEGYALAEDYVCLDEGVSGATLVRRGLDRIRDGALAGAFDAVLPGAGSPVSPSAAGRDEEGPDRPRGTERSLPG